MKILIIANVYSQLIIAIQMRRTVFKNDDVSIMVSDISKDACRYSRNLENEKVFDSVYYVEARKYSPEPVSMFKKMTSISRIVSGNKVFREIYDETWDKLCFYNTDTATYSLYVSLAKKNPELECIMFEEGIMSYSTPFSDNMRYRIAEKALSLRGIRSLQNATKTFYCFYPEQYSGKFAARKIPKIDMSDQGFVNIIRRVFEVDAEKNNRIYSRKYIYFSGVYDFEGGSPIGELDLIERVSDAVGKDNMVVKVHPRDITDRFIERGLNVAESSNVPWEAIQMTSDLEGVTFLTTISGSVLFTNLITNAPVKSVFLFPLCDLSKNEMASRNVKDIRRIVNDGVEGKALPWIVFCDDIEKITE